MGGVRRKSGGGRFLRTLLRLPVASSRLAVGSLPIYASTHLPFYERRDPRYEIRPAAEAIVRNKANFGVCGLPMGGRAGIIVGLWEFGLEMDNPW